MKTLRIGDTGEDVMMLQKLLGVHADGLFGKNTETALKMFQAHNRLDVDGIAGPKTWAALLGGGLKKSSRKINEIIIHCTATPEGKDVTVEAIRNYHMKQRGWSDIGYHYVIYRDGSVHNGRDVDKAGAHTTNHNQHSIGIAYVGGCKDNTNPPQPKDTRTPEQKQAIRTLVNKLKMLYPGATVHGHNEYANKACPCYDVRKENY